MASSIANPLTRHKSAALILLFMQYVSVFFNDLTYTEIVTLQEELPALLQIYERRGYFDEVLSLLEAGLSLERAHVSFAP